MSIKSQIQRIAAAKSAIIESIRAKGIAIQADTAIDKIPPIIDSMSVVELPEEYNILSDYLTSGAYQTAHYHGVTVPNSLYSSQSNLQHATISDITESIGTTSYSGCTSLKSFSFPQSLKRIESSAFLSCSGLTELALPGDCSLAGGTATASAFRNCTNLLNITIGGPGDPYETGASGAYAFYLCSTVQSVVIYTESGTGPDQYFYKNSSTTYHTIEYRKA